MAFCLKYLKNGKEQVETYQSYYVSIVRQNKLRQKGYDVSRYEKKVFNSNISDTSLGTKMAWREKEMLDTMTGKFAITDKSRRKAEMIKKGRK